MKVKVRRVILINVGMISFRCWRINCNIIWIFFSDVLSGDRVFVLFIKVFFGIVGICFLFFLCGERGLGIVFII